MFCSDFTVRVFYTEYLTVCNLNVVIQFKNRHKDHICSNNSRVGNDSLLYLFSPSVHK